MDITTEVPPPAEMLRAVEERWTARAKAQQFKPSSTKYRNAEVEFFVGAMAALTAQGYAVPAGWSIKIMSGRPVVDLSKEPT